MRNLRQFTIFFIVTIVFIILPTSLILNYQSKKNLESLHRFYAENKFVIYGVIVKKTFDVKKGRFTARAIDSTEMQFPKTMFLEDSIGHYIFYSNESDYENFKVGDTVKFDTFNGTRTVFNKEKRITVDLPHFKSDGD